MRAVPTVPAMYIEMCKIQHPSTHLPHSKSPLPIPSELKCFPLLYTHLHQQLLLHLPLGHLSQSPLLFMFLLQCSLQQTGIRMKRTAAVAYSTPSELLRAV